VDVNVTAAVITSIQVTPSSVKVAQGKTQQLIVTATYSDWTSSDITSSATWNDIDTNIATVTAAGVLSGVKLGSTTLTATKDGVTSNKVTVTVCGDLAGACIDIFNTGSGKLFTNSPSEAYVDSIGGIATNYVYYENGSRGPAGNFYRFNWNNANALCAAYSANSIGGRTNWRLATKDELKVELFDTYGKMFPARGWPGNRYYWSGTPDGSNYYEVGLGHGGIISSNVTVSDYVSCVSEL
jgi:hypothetical protein